MVMGIWGGRSAVSEIAVSCQRSAISYQLSAGGHKALPYEYHPHLTSSPVKGEENNHAGIAALRSQ